MVCLEFVLRQLLLVDGPPAVDDIGQDEGYEERNIEHGTQGKLATARVCKRQRRLQVGGRRIIGGVVPG